MHQCKAELVCVCRVGEDGVAGWPRVDGVNDCGSRHLLRGLGGQGVLHGDSRRCRSVGDPYVGGV